MTGFGQAEYRTPRLKFSAQARSVNHRFLDIKLKLPRSEWMALDHAARKKVSEKFARGAIEVLVTVEALSAKNSGAQSVQFSVIENILDQVQAWQKKKKMKTAPVSMDTLLRLPGVFANPVAAELEDFDESVLVSKLIEPALESLAKARAAEGVALKTHLLDLLRQMRQHAEKIASLESEEQERTHKTVLERVQRTLELLGKASQGSAEEFTKRLHEEAAFWIDRRSFEEERVRFAAHLDSFEKALEATTPGPKGKKLEFLQQELHREVNTLGNKAQSTKIAEHALALKSIIENLKEQLANVE